MSFLSRFLPSRCAKPSSRPARARLAVEGLEDRSLPSTLAAVPMEQVSAVHTAHVAHVRPTKAITIARNEAKALQRAITSFQAQLLDPSMIPITRPILSQVIQLDRNELRATNKMLTALLSPKLKWTPSQAVDNVFALQVKFAKANAALQALQVQEALTLEPLPFHSPVKF